MVIPSFDTYFKYHELPKIEEEHWGEINPNEFKEKEAKQKLNEKAWYISSEKNYYKHHQTYYKNLRLLGLEYHELDYSKALPFPIY